MEISLKGMFTLALVKKERFCGSCGPMRYMLCKSSDDRLQAGVYPEPYCWDATPSEQKETQLFELSDAGIEAAVAWLNEKLKEYEAEEEE